MKTYLLALALAATFFGCDTKEKENLQRKIDSLDFLLAEGEKAELAMNEVATLLDSIDANRHVLHLRITEGVAYAD